MSDMSKTYMTNKDAFYTNVGNILLSDINITNRHFSNNACSKIEIKKLSSFIIQQTNNMPIVYTAFDGDMFHLIPLMRRYVYMREAIPANPESILGYNSPLKNK